MKIPQQDDIKLKEHKCTACTVDAYKILSWVLRFFFSFPAELST